LFANVWATSLSVLRLKRTRNELVNTAPPGDDELFATLTVPNKRPTRQIHFIGIALWQKLFIYTFFLSFGFQKLFFIIKSEEIIFDVALYPCFALENNKAMTYIRFLSKDGKNQYHITDCRLENIFNTFEANEQMKGKFMLNTSLTFCTLHF
jgi:hypothetical protein